MVRRAGRTNAHTMPTGRRVQVVYGCAREPARAVRLGADREGHAAAQAALVSRRTGHACTRLRSRAARSSSCLRQAVLVAAARSPVPSAKAALAGHNAQAILLVLALCAAVCVRSLADRQCARSRAACACSCSLRLGHSRCVCSAFVSLEEKQNKRRERKE